MAPVHYLSYSFTYLVATAASEQIAFLKQRKAQFLLHRAYSARLTSCLACYIGFWDALEFHMREHMQNTEPHLRHNCHFMHIFGTQICASCCCCPRSTIHKDNEKFVENNCKGTISLICLKNHSPSFGENCTYTLRTIICRPEALFI